MKKIVVLLALCLASTASFSQNTMRMVTYFPVPYVAYNDIEVTQFCEVGLLNQCNMALGPGDTTQNPYTLNVYKNTENGVAGNKLNTGVLNVTSGTLNLNSEGVNNKITGNTLEAGAGSVQSNSEIGFEHQLNVSGTNNVPSRSVSSQTNAQIKEIKMFPDRVANNLPGCAEGVTWQRIQVGASNTGALDEVFLVCGSPVINQVCKSAKPTTERTCSTGCGKQTRKVSCNVNTGQWEAGAWVGACSAPPKTFRNCVEGCGTQSRSYSCDGTRWVPTQWTGSCWAPYGGGQTRGCSSGCGTETSTSTCSGASWSGNCWSPYCSRSCGCSSCGSQYCVSDCNGGYCSGSCWSAYGGGTQTQSCGNGGTQSRSCSSTCYGASCGNWGACGGEKVDTTTKPPTITTAPPVTGCTTTCSGGRSQRAYPDCSCYCPSGTTWNGSKCCGTCSGSSTETAACDSGYKGNKTRSRSCNCGSWSAWGAWNTSGCTKEKSCSWGYETDNYESQLPTTYITCCYLNSPAGTCRSHSSSEKCDESSAGCYHVESTYPNGDRWKVTRFVCRCR